MLRPLGGAGALCTRYLSYFMFYDIEIKTIYIYITVYLLVFWRSELCSNRYTCFMVSSGSLYRLLAITDRSEELTDPLKVPKGKCT